MEKSYKEYLKNIDTFIFDVDGVFTDSSILITEDVKLRLQGLGVKDIYMGAHHKQEPLTNYLSKQTIKAENALYMGDDFKY